MRWLRKQGFETETVEDLGLLGAPDSAIVGAAEERQATILTLDLDFGRIFVEQDPRVQIVVLRPSPAIPSRVGDVLERLLSTVDLESAELEGSLIVADASGYRVRQPER